VVLLAAGEPALLPPPYVLPPDVEYQTGDDLLALLADGRGGADGRGKQAPSVLPALTGSPVAWADQVVLALTETLVAGAGAIVRAARMRWERGFALAALAGAMPCGLGLCLACPVETRDGPRLRCKEGPVFDLRELR
jgi:dihydroorotate dehydrogenase electron transfer subunit